MPCNSIQRTSSENIDIKEGAILIAGNTSPDLVPIINKVLAIVTDEGGLLCHAAIIAREPIPMSNKVLFLTLLIFNTATLSISI